MFAAIRNRLFRAFGDWVIQRAMRTPYTHLFHDDGRPYMQRFWLLRIGMPKGWRKLEEETSALERAAKHHPYLTDFGRRNLECAIAENRQKLYPRFGIRIHRIQSSDVPVFHDHPWNYTTLILRGGYTEYQLSPTIIQSGITETDQFDGTEPTTYTDNDSTRYNAGALLRRRAGSWHYLALDPGTEAWTMFCVGRKRKCWGFLADGLVKVSWRLYLQRRRERMVANAQWSASVQEAALAAGAAPLDFNTIVQHHSV